MPDQESSHVRSAQRARSYDGMGRAAKPSAALRSWPRGVEHALLNDLGLPVHDCSDALSLEYQNTERDEDQRQQPSNAERFLQEHEPNKQDDAHLCCRDDGR